MGAFILRIVVVGIIGGAVGTFAVAGEFPWWTYITVCVAVGVVSAEWVWGVR